MNLSAVLFQKNTLLTLSIFCLASISLPNYSVGSSKPAGYLQENTNNLAHPSTANNQQVRSAPEQPVVQLDKPLVQIPKSADIQSIVDEGNRRAASGQYNERTPYLPGSKNQRIYEQNSDSGSSNNATSSGGATYSSEQLGTDNGTYSSSSNYSKKANASSSGSGSGGANVSVSGSKCGSNIYGGYPAACTENTNGAGIGLAVGAGHGSDLFKGLNLGGIVKNAALGTAVDLAIRGYKGEAVNGGILAKNLGAGVVASVVGKVAQNAAKDAFGPGVLANAVAGGAGSAAGTLVRGGNPGQAFVSGAAGSAVGTATKSPIAGAAAGGAVNGAFDKKPIVPAALRGATDGAIQDFTSRAFGAGHGERSPVVSLPGNKVVTTVTN
jgi:hypothetical protein